VTLAARVHVWNLRSRRWTAAPGPPGGSRSYSLLPAAYAGNRRVFVEVLDGNGQARLALFDVPTRRWTGLQRGSGCAFAGYGASRDGRRIGIVDDCGQLLLLSLRHRSWGARTVRLRFKPRTAGGVSVTFSPDDGSVSLANAADNGFVDIV